MKHITFIDSIGRTILGEEINRTDTTLVVKNPAMISVQQAQNGQLQVQLIPLFFSEFIEASQRADGSTWTYNTNTLTVGEVQADDRLVEQYARVFGAVAPQQPQSENPEVVKLFDE
jgi:hypothetical protein